MKALGKALADGFVLLDLKAGDLESIFQQVLNQVVARGLLSVEHRDEVEAALLSREQGASTAIGHGAAVPHLYREGFTEPVVVFVRLHRPLNLRAPDGIPTRFLFVLLGPPAHAVEHLDTLANIARLVSDDEFRYEAGKANTPRELTEALNRFLARTAPPPPQPGTTEADGLEHTGRWFGGLMADIRRRLPHYPGDFRDGLHPKVLASTLFLFFACLAPAVTFGGMMAEMTDNHIGAVEMIAASAVCGVTFALTSGQPLIILGGTGPVLIFTAMLYRLCGDLDLPFFAMYVWTGLWTAVLLVVLAVTNASRMMRLFTRFTDEIFAALISVIFIYEAVRALIRVSTAGDISYGTVLLSILLALGTFYIATTLSRFRRSRYLLPQIREFLADFGPTIALATMTGVAIWLHEVDLATLPAPDTFRPTHTDASGASRSWLLNPFAGSIGLKLTALGPAVILTILLFLDQNITSRLINSPDNKLRKGAAYHQDLGVVGLLVGVCSVFGLPWLVAATVRSLNHVRSLATFESVAGEKDSHERILHVRENRVSGLSIHILLGLSLLLLPVLKLIPMVVLYGLFLFMGFVSIQGNQFFERLALWPMDPSLYPASHYIRRVPRRTIHIFTIIQMACFAVLWVVKESPLGILFPLFIALLVPVRLLLGRYFAPEHLAALDADELPEEEETHWI